MFAERMENCRKITSALPTDQIERKKMEEEKKEKGEETNYC